MIKHLSEIYNSWQQLPDEEKIIKINQILPFIQLTSTLKAVNHLQNNRDDLPFLEEILDNFKAEYQKLFNQDISVMNKSDFNQKIFDQIVKINNGEAEIDDQFYEELLKYKNKYEHAHSRIMFQYGDILLTTYQHLPKEEQDKILASTIAELFKNSAKTFRIEQFSDKINKDNLENDALLNQITNFSANVRDYLAIILSEERSRNTIEFFESKQQKHVTEPNKSGLESDKDLIISSAQFLEKLNCKMMIGLECEFLLSPIFPETAISNLEKNQIIKQILSDVNARRQIQEKYGFLPTIPKIDNFTKFFFPLTQEDVMTHLTQQTQSPDSTSESPKDGLTQSLRNFDLNLILHNLTKYIEDLGNDWQKIKGANNFNSQSEFLQHLKEQIHNFTKAEIFFYKTMFLQENKTEFSIDSIAGTPDEKHQAVISMINDGTFHQNLIDAIRAYEISIGPYSLTETLDKKSETIQSLKLSANRTGLYMHNINVQINHSFYLGDKNIFYLEVSKDNDETVIYTNALARLILQTIQEAIAETSELNPTGFLRDQKEIETRCDKNKGIAKDIEGSDYSTIDTTIPPYLQHRISTARNSTLRMSIIPNSKDGVAELRLAGGNPQFGHFTDAQQFDDTAIDYIPEIFLPILSKKIMNALHKQDLQQLYEEKVPIEPNGRIKGLKPTKIENIELSGYDVFDPSNPTKDKLKELRENRFPTPRPKAIKITNSQEFEKSNTLN